MNYLHPPRLEALARDYAVGTLRGRARRRFERVLREAPEAMRAVADWQQRLARLAEAVPAAAPREAVWIGIEARLFGSAEPARAKQAVRPVGSRVWLPFGSGATARPAGAGLVIGLLAGAVLAVVALRWQPPWAAKVGLEAAGPGLPAAYVGILSDSQGAMVLASSRRHGQVLTIKWLRPVTLPPGQAARLWALPKDGSAPVSVGVLPVGSNGTIALPASSEAIFAKVDRLAVGLELAGGPAAVAPAKPYFAEGACAKLW
jgi:anti-sigma-K factor RskA